MSVGQGSISVNQKAPVIPAPAPPGPPFLPASADNGTSIDPVTGRIVLGQAIGEPGDPAQLLSDREIPLNNFFLRYGINNTRFFISELIDFITAVTQNFEVSAGGFFMQRLNQAIGRYEFGDISGFNNSSNLAIDDLLQTIQLSSGLNPGLLLDFSGDYLLGDVNGVGNSGLIDVFDSGNRIGLSIGNINPAQMNLRKSSETFNVILDGGIKFNIDAVLGAYQLGDIFGSSGNGMFLEVDDSLGELKLTNIAANSAVRINGNLGFTGTVTPVTTITVVGGIVTNVA